MFRVGGLIFLLETSSMNSNVTGEGVVLPPPIPFLWAHS
jgi:hypothetical protein